MTNFLWGAATSAFQVEGSLKIDGRGQSIWDKFQDIPGNIVDDTTADIAANSYNQFKDDVRAIKELGANCYRFSISWTRILPNGNGEINIDGIKFYNNIIDYLKQNNLEPIVTLFHWDSPENLEKYGGWLDKTGTIINDFVKYAEICFENFGDRVKYWATFNEAQTFAVTGYEQPYFAPGIGRTDGISPIGYEYTVGHNILLAHGYTVQSYRTNFQEMQKGKIGMVNNMDYVVPYTSSKQDKLAADTYMTFWGGWFFDPLFFGNYPDIMRKIVGDRLPKFTHDEQILLKGSLDIMFLNHYTAFYASDRPGESPPGWIYDMKANTSYTNTDGVLIGKETQSPWNHIVPYSPYGILEFYYNRYNIKGYPGISVKIDKNVISIPIMFTENGMAVIGETKDSTYEECRNDTDRIDYYSGCLNSIGEAIRDFKIDVIGYTAWSLLDNFEWATGYGARFGMYYVDFNFPTSEFRPRYPKDSVKWYNNYIKDHPNGPMPSTYNLSKKK